MTQDATKPNKDLLQELAVLRQRVGILEAVDVARQQANATLDHQVREQTAALHEANRHLTRLAAKVVLAEEQERHRIAQGLHDQVGQLLAVATGTLDTVRAEAATGDLGRSLDTIRALVDQALQEVRSLTFTLSSPLLSTLGLEAALAHLGEQMGDEHGFRFQCTTDRQPIPLPDALRLMLYRAARELLGNVVTHAQARQVWMAVHRVGTHLHLTVHDDGVGFDSAASGTGFTPTGGFGLFSIRLQVDAIGGTLAIDSGPGTGSRIRLVVPLECRHRS